MPMQLLLGKTAMADNADLFEQNRLDAEEFCRAAFGPFGVDTAPLCKS
jgi:hypothetical protein